MALSSAGSANALHHTALWVARSVEPGPPLRSSSVPGALDGATSGSEMKALGAGGGVTLTGRTSAHAPEHKVITRTAIGESRVRGVGPPTAPPAGRGGTPVGSTKRIMGGS